MSDLPYDDILQAVAECVADLDRADEISNGMLGRLFAPMERLQDLQATRAKRADEYAGTHRRAFETVKGSVTAELPEPQHETHDRTEDQPVDIGGV